MKIVNKKRFITFMAICLVALIFNISIAKTELKTEDYTVAQGDTIWKIACENASGDVRKYVHELRKINDLDDCTIYPGQVLKIIK